YEMLKKKHSVCVSGSGDHCWFTFLIVDMPLLIGCHCSSHIALVFSFVGSRSTSFSPLRENERSSGRLDRERSIERIRRSGIRTPDKRCHAISGGPLFAIPHPIISCIW